MKIEDIEPCPFCGAPVIDHPDTHTDGVLYIVYHKPDCYLKKFIPKGILYLIHIDELKSWNDRTIETMGRKNTP